MEAADGGIEGAARAAAMGASATRATHLFLFI
jgi:hypothetical protein